jgi:D-alanine-D-alanine ligase
MAKKFHVAIVFNEPTIDADGERKYISEAGSIEPMPSHAEFVAGAPKKLVDMSEVGVLEEREQVASALKANGYRTSLFSVKRDMRELIDFLETNEPDLIFNLCESVANNASHEMFVAGIYELMGIPYTGSAAMTLGTCLNKARTKEILAFHKIPTAKFRLVQNAKDVDDDDFDLRFPLIVKPFLEDASIGIDNNSIVESVAALKKRIRYIYQNFDQAALVEEYIEGREVNVGIMGNAKPFALPISEIDFSGLPASYPKIVTYNAKWMEGTEEYVGTVGKCPAELPQEVEDRVKDVALRAYKIMGIRDYGRVDIRLDKRLNPYVLEVNPNPDISDSAGFARSAKSYGLAFNDIINKIVELAWERTP